MMRLSMLVLRSTWPEHVEQEASGMALSLATLPACWHLPHRLSRCAMVLPFMLPVMLIARSPGNRG